MSQVDEDTQNEAYTEAVKSGLYAKRSGLVGKYDNVRRYWEDQLTRYTLHIFLAPFVYAKRKALERVRVIDLGCGSGEGYEILTDLRAEAQLTQNLDGKYKGLLGAQALAGSVTGSNSTVTISGALAIIVSKADTSVTVDDYAKLTANNGMVIPGN